MEELTMEVIYNLCLEHKLRWTNHIFIRLLQRNINISDVEYALLNGEILEQYQNDNPYPSCLVLGTTVNNKCLHVVCALGDKELWLITAYYPDSKRWINNFKTRKED